MVTLGLNIDHVATLRQARRDIVPNVLQAAFAGIQGGAEGITVHLREDRRHIQDADVRILKERIDVPLNLEMSIAPEIVRFASQIKPAKACLVPERRQELTTEGGLDVAGQKHKIRRVVSILKKAGIVVSLFIDPVEKQIRASAWVGAQFVELHTGTYARFRGRKQKKELNRLKEAALYAHALGLGVNAGHGLNLQNVGAVAKLPHVEELNIGHAIIAQAVFVGLKQATREMVMAIGRTKRKSV
ncbi:MAG: pyridoxine 5'-phosphate synthase [Candidatus Omnitrophica bacterium CG11_big_fil_rev_8_21_14_0_20_45_26]|uniref:Pyridoxine 5'-phosphate synthase n=1 Tax=Candidatus Abzuiibacterium crystallinum TaxID=1974748 RepID=A0A2H0LKM5_9BACT|nr:MAG: pyridoxine 5'-phosphate synthase [Candidatus Omnitrophica bacterium CG11_big_fil_rev_8_21_14_0_20_45_26]